MSCERRGSGSLRECRLTVSQSPCSSALILLSFPRMAFQLIVAFSCAPYAKDLVNGEKRLVTYKEWADLIQSSFEKCYYVPQDPSQDKEFNVNSGMVNRRGIYKDVYGTPKDREWSDYQVSYPARIEYSQGKANAI